MGCAHWGQVEPPTQLKAVPIGVQPVHAASAVYHHWDQVTGWLDSFRLELFSMPRPTKRARRHIEAAYKKAEALGRLVPVVPASKNSVDGSPILGDGQAYATFAGEVFHSLRCRVVADKLDNDPRGIVVIDLSTVGGRRECRTCQTERGI